MTVLPQLAMRYDYEPPLRVPLRRMVVVVRVGRGVPHATPLCQRHVSLAYVLARRRCTLLKSRRAPTPLGQFLARRPLVLVFSGDPGSLLPPVCSLRSNACTSPTVRVGAPWRLNQVFQAFASAAEQNLLHLMQAVAAASCTIKTTCHGAIATRVNITRGRGVLVARRLQVETVPTGRCATAML